MDAVLLSRWNFDPSLVAGLLGLGLAYLAMLRTPLPAPRASPPRPLSIGDGEGEDVLPPLPLGEGWGEGVPRPLSPGLPVSSGQVVAFAVALLALALALMSPLDYLSDHVLFVAHMLQHLALLLLAPPLLVFGWPVGWLQAMGRWLAEARPIGWIARPLPALLLSIGVVWIWHAPAFYEAALGDETIHAGEHLCFLATALLYWWPVVRPETYPWPFPDLLLLGYLLAALFASTLLGAVLTFAPTVLYPTYAHPADATLAPAIAALGITPLVDQQLGGLLMWVGAGLWYLGAAACVFARWFARPVVDDIIQGVQT